jgi:integrase
VATCLAASTVLLYAVRLRELLEHALGGRGLGPREARERARRAMAAVPWADLRREARRHLKGREALVSPGELEALMEEARHPRSRALIAVLHESACRKGEILGLRVRDVVDAGTHLELRVLGKTGERVVPLVTSRPDLEAWLEAHPDPRPSAPLFATGVRGAPRRLHVNTPNKLLKDLCRKAGLRHVTPHMMRHTRLTELARAGVGEYVLKSFAGWTPDSKMAARYVHLSGRDHVPAILRLVGVDPTEVGA